MSEFIHIMTLPLLACLVLAGIHAYLGFHVIERQVIFVDLALAQVAVLGASLALVAGYDLDSVQSYWFSLGFSAIGAAIFSLSRFKKEVIPQEAIIGITYAVSAALLVIVLSRNAQGDEHIKQALVGNILLVSLPEVVKMAIIYSIIGAIHFMFRYQFLMISRNPDEAFKKGVRVKAWDFFFYILFGFVVTSSVKIAGVLLVFSFLVVPPICAILLASDLKSRLIVGWVIGVLASILGISASYCLDLPTGAAVICTFGILLITIVLVKKILVRKY